MPDEPTHSGVKETLKKKGPLGIPSIAWVGIGLIVGYLVYRWYENYSATQAANANTTGTSGSTTPEGDGTTGTGDTTGTTPGTGTTTGTGTTPQQVLSGLAGWLSAAQQWASSNGYTASDIASGFGSWAGGACVSAVQYTMIDNAIAALGAPSGGPNSLQQCQPISVTGTAGDGGSGSVTTSTSGATAQSSSIGASAGAPAVATPGNQQASTVSTLTTSALQGLDSITSAPNPGPSLTAAQEAAIVASSQAYAKSASAAVSSILTAPQEPASAPVVATPGHQVASTENNTTEAQKKALE